MLSIATRVTHVLVLVRYEDDSWSAESSEKLPAIQFPEWTYPLFSIVWINHLWLKLILAQTSWCRRPFLKLLSSLIVVGLFIVAMAMFLAWSTLMPLWCTWNPRNFPVNTSKAHFTGFMRSLYFLHLSKTCLISGSVLPWFLTLPQYHPHHIMEDSCHGSLVGGSYIFTAEGHHSVIKISDWGPKCCLLYISSSHADLVIPTISIHKWKHGVSRSWIYKEVNIRQGELIFRTCFFRLLKSTQHRI